MKKFWLTILLIILPVRSFPIEITIGSNEFTNVGVRELQVDPIYALPTESIVIDLSKDTNITRHSFNRFSFLIENIGNNKLAKFFKKEHGISLVSSQNLLGIPVVSGIFSVYFTFLPSRLDKGTVLARFFSTDETDKYIEIKLEKSRIQVNINGIVYTREGDKVNVVLVSDEKIVVQEMYEFSLVFDVVNSKISIYLNGVETDRKILKSANFELSTPESIIEFFPSFFGYARTIVIAPTFIRSLGSTPAKGGELISRVIDTKDPSSAINKVTLVGRGNFIVLARVSKDIYKHLLDELPWLTIEDAKNTKGRYLQFKLFPVEDEQSSEFLGLKVELSKNIPPQKPHILYVEPRANGEVTIHWRNDLDEEVEYYELFYGDHQNKYFGNASSNGPSPIKIKKPSKFYPVLRYTVRGLKMNRTYYFSIRSVRRDGTKSEYSDEVKVIPSKEVNSL
ncbi:MAG: fibronectin type III domain-containing protein [Brevinematia bacterium]